MKKILFRGKRTDRDKWVQGYYVFNTNGFDFDDDEYKEYHRIQPLQPNGMLDIIREVDPATVGQYTGLTDKNGIMIFEGDILQRNNSWYGGGVAEVKTNIWNCGCCHDVYGFSTENDDNISLRDDDIEVIGNIHDNAELMGDI